MKILVLISLLAFSVTAMACGESKTKTTVKSDTTTETKDKTVQSQG